MLLVLVSSGPMHVYLPLKSPKCSGEVQYVFENMHTV